MKQRITLSIDENIVDRIEKARGLVPRSPFVERMLVERMVPHPDPTPDRDLHTTQENVDSEASGDTGGVF